MNLLPKTTQEFGRTEYWNEFFKKRGKKAFDWYGEYPELCEQLHKYIRLKDVILMVGCGNSKLSMDMYDIGFREITNIDISEVVIKQMQNANKEKRPDMKFLEMDATAMEFSDESFSVIIDKGTLDALMSENSEEVLEIGRKYCGEIARTLKNGGRYICISLLQEHILRLLLEYMPSNNFMFRVVRCFEAEQKTATTSPDGTTMPVFVVIATKFTPLKQKVLEICLGGNKMQRLESIEELFEAVSSVQKASLVCNGLNRTNIVGMDEVRIDLYQPGTEKPRYTVYVLDQTPSRTNGQYAAFIVPVGREVEWLFGTPKGRKKLLHSSRHNRLAIVALHRDQNYISLEEVKSELSESIRNLAPNNLKEQIPYLSVGQNVNVRDIIGTGKTKFSGAFVVEEVQDENEQIFRRLIFLDNESVVQSEALLRIIKPKNKLPRTKIDIGHLACLHHLYMSIGANYGVSNCGKKEGDVLVIGLGGGSLCMFLREILRHSKVICVDIDPAILEIAVNFFDLREDNRLQVVIEDGLTYIEKAAQEKKQFGAVLFDVDSKDLSLGMSCPPPSFLEPIVMDNVKTLIGEKGIFILNLVCRDETMRDEVIIDLRKLFKSVCSYDVEENLNVVVYCTNHEIKDWTKVLEIASESINTTAKQLKFTKTEMINMTQYLRNLEIEDDVSDKK